MNAQRPMTIYEHGDGIAELSSVVDLVKLSDQYRQSAILHFAVAEHLFDRTSTSATARDISQQLGWVANKAKIFLNGLVALGLLEKSADTYINKPLAQRFLVSTSGAFIGPIIAHQRLQWQNWQRLGEILSATDSLDFQQENRFKHDIAARDAFNDAMVRFSQPMVDVLKELPVFDTAKKIIDLAGGHGTYIAEIARRHPQVHGEIWDLATTRQSAENTIEKYQLTGRLTFKERDLLALSQFGDESADVIMINDCLHYFTREETSALIHSAAQLVNEGGSMLILSMTLDNDEIHPMLSADFSLHMMVNTVNGELHPTSWIATQMIAQGFEVVQEPIGRYSLLLGRRADGRVA